MGWLDAAKTVFGSGGTPAARPSVPSTRDQDRQRKRAAKDTAARQKRVTAYKRRVARGDEGLPFGKRGDWS